MASIYRPTYTVATSAGSRERRQARTWWASYRDAANVVRRVSLHTTSKAAAQMKLADLVHAAGQGRDDSGPRAAARRPLSSHIDDYSRYLETADVTPHYHLDCLRKIRTVVAGCGWRTLTDIDADELTAFLATLPRYGKPGTLASPATRAQHVAHWQTFCNWMVPRRLAVSPLADLSISRGGERRHERRPMTPAELHGLLTAAASSRTSYCGLTGYDRYHLYLAASSTGFRAAELASLGRSAFHLHASPPIIRLAGKHAKNRKAVDQPLPASIVPQLSTYLATRPVDGPVWPGGWYEKASIMIRVDLDAAGIPHSTPGPDGPVYVDFHSLRSTFIALLDQPGVTPRQAMQLARHSDPRLTFKVYGRRPLEDLAAAVNLMASPCGPCTNLGTIDDGHAGDVNSREVAGTLPFPTTLPTSTARRQAAQDVTDCTCTHCVTIALHAAENALKNDDLVTILARAGLSAADIELVMRLRGRPAA